MEITELLDRAKSMANIESDYALAKVLGITAGNLSNIRKGRAHPSNEIAVKIATLAKLEDMRVIAEIEMRTANTEKKREFWKSYIDTKGLTATLRLIVLGLSIMATPDPAEANVLQMQNYGAHFHVQNTQKIYIMRISGLPLSALASGDQKAVEIKASIPSAPVLIRCAKFAQNVALSCVLAFSASNSAININGWIFSNSPILTAI